MRTIAKKIAVTFGVMTFLLLFQAFTAFAAPHEILPWHGNHKGAVSITFDDGVDTQYTVGFPALEQRGMKGTFFITTGRAEWPMWIDVAKAGHEIGSHGVGHRNLTELTLEEVDYQMRASQEAINANITSQRCLTFAYPYGARNDSVIAVAAKYYIAARRVKGTLNDPTVPLYTEYAYDINYYTLDQMKGFADQAATEGKWLVPLFHSFDVTQYPYGIWTTEMYLNYLDYLKAERSDLWIAPFGSVIKYMRERGTATLTVSSETDKSIELALTDTLDNAIFNHPLTIRSEVPSVWEKVRMQQGTKVVELTPVSEGATSFVIYDAVPDQGTITLSEPAPSPSAVAKDDAYAVSQKDELKVAAPGLLQNDSGPEGDALRAILVRGPAHGHLKIHSDGSFSYKPQSRFFGTDTFSYLANHGAYDSNIAVVTITVLPGKLKDVDVERKDVSGGSSVVGKVKFEHQLEKDALVTLSSDSPAATVPASVTVPAGSKEAEFQITTAVVSEKTAAHITGSYGMEKKDCKLEVKP